MDILVIPSLIASLIAAVVVGVATLKLGVSHVGAGLFAAAALPIVPILWMVVDARPKQRDEIDLDP